MTDPSSYWLQKRESQGGPEKREPETNGEQPCQREGKKKGIEKSIYENKIMMGCATGGQKKGASQTHKKRRKAWTMFAETHKKERKKLHKENPGTCRRKASTKTFNQQGDLETRDQPEKNEDGFQQKKRNPGENSTTKSLEKGVGHKGKGGKP